MKILKIPFLLFFISVATIFPVKGETLKETSLKILKGSLEFQNDTYSLETLSVTFKTESNLPDPELAGEYLFAPGDEPNRWGLELSWGLEWPGVYGARSREAKSKMTSADKSLYLKRMERLLEIRKLLLEFVLCEQRLSLLEELSNNNDSIYRLSEQMARGGELTALDLNKVRLEYANIRGARASLLDEKSSVTASLSEIYGQDCTPLLDQMECKFPEISLPPASLISQIGERNADKEVALAEVESARAAQRVAEMEALPSLSIGFKHAYEDMVHFNGPTLGISLPVFSSRGKRKAAKAAIAEAELKAETAGKTAETEAMMTLRRLELLKSQLDEIEPVLKNSDHNSLLLKAYKGGAITMVEYLSERNYFTSAASEFLNLKYSAALAQAELMKYFEVVDFIN